MNLTSLFSYMPSPFKERAEENLDLLIKIALHEDGADLTAEGVFPENAKAKARIITKEESFAVGLPLIPLIFTHLGLQNKDFSWKSIEEGKFVPVFTEVALIEAPTIALLKAERIILNFITHLSGIANLTKEYLDKLEGTEVKLLDTRKTLPGMRYLEKYAVHTAGACNHRLALDDMLMLKDNHIDAAGSITKAVELIRHKYQHCLPIEIECRTLADVLEAVSLKPERIMLDNMSFDMLKQALPSIPSHIEAEISGNVNLNTIRDFALVCPSRKPDFISVGRITHSAPTADFSLQYYN